MRNPRSQQRTELFLRQTGFTNERAKRAFGQFPVIRHGQPAARSVAKNDIAAGLVIHDVTDALERLDRVRAGTDGQAAHAGISTISSVIPGGIGSPCFLRLARYPWIASQMLAIASSRVFPCETQPGSAGHPATKTPSSSGSMITRNFIRVKITSVPARRNIGNQEPGRTRQSRRLHP